jgi:hypothetical protein
VQLGDELGDVAVSLVGVVGRCPVDHAKHRRRQRPADLADLATQPCQGVGDDDSEAVDVGSRRHRSVVELLRRGVRRAQRRRTGRVIRRFSVGAHGDSEIGQVGIALVVDQDVGRLDIAVHDTGTVCDFGD